MKFADLLAFAAVLIIGLIFAQFGIRALETEQKAQDQIITSHIDHLANNQTKD